MPRNEHEFTKQVVAALEREGYAVKREVRVPGRQRLDLVGSLANVRYGVEVKFNGRDLLNDLVKGYAMLRLPDVDEVYVCAPSVVVSDDAHALAAKLGVGLLALDDAGTLHWLTKSQRLEPARLALNGAYMKPRGKRPFNVVRPGGKVLYKVAVFNHGQKSAVNVEVFMVSAGPFVAKKRSKARVKKALLERSGPTAWSTILECQVKAGTPPGTYPLMISVTADGVARDNMTVHYEVERV